MCAAWATTWRRAGVAEARLIRNLDMVGILLWILPRFSNARNDVQKDRRMPGSVDGLSAPAEQ